MPRRNSLRAQSVASAVDLPSLDPSSSRRCAGKGHRITFGPMKKILIIEDNRELGAILGAAACLNKPFDPAGR